MRHYLFVGLIAAAASPLFAQPLPAPAPMLARGPAPTITRAEIQARVQAHFAQRDANRDGVLTADELAMRGMKVRHGGKLAGEHALRDPDAAFDRIDANRDGSISRDEFAHGRQVRIEKRVIVKGDGQPGAMGAMHGMPRGGGMIGAGMLAVADTDGDGRVTLAEATSGALRHFDMMDANRDGRLTPEERAAGRIHMRQMRTAG